MRICFTLDDVLRAKTVQIGKIYKKYIDGKINLDELDFSTNDYKEIFGFKDTDSWNKFLYEDYPFDIFGNAPVTEKMVDKNFLLWLLDAHEYDEYDEDVTVIISNPFEFNASIGCSYFFLAKIATRVREIYFPEDSSEIWEKCDVLVTADPKLIESKPEGKTCVKIKMPYNESIESDFTYEKLSELLEDKDFLNKMFNNKNKEHDD